MSCLAWRAPQLSEADASSAEEAGPADPGKGPPEERAQQGHSGPQQTGEPVPWTAETQPYTEGTHLRTQVTKHLSDPELNLQEVWFWNFTIL